MKKAKNVTIIGPTPSLLAVATAGAGSGAKAGAKAVDEATDILRAGSKAAEGTANLTTAELKQLYPRATPRRGLAEEVWERSKAPNGKVYDPSGVEIKPGDYWELGHTPGNQIPDARLRAAQEGWDRATWRKYQNDPDIYRPELRPTNRSHAHESDW